MAVTLTEFQDRLSANGLSELALSVTSRQPEDIPFSAEAAAQHLITEGKLTPFQTSRLLNDPALPLTLGPYLLIDRIGAGGMGVVYKAEHCHMKRIVAIKQLPADSLRSPVTLQRFYREVRTVAQLDHPNIVTAYDAGESNGAPYLAMEYVQGKDLGSILHEQGCLSVPQAVDIVLQAAMGLACAHQQGVVHRDVKPGNILVAYNGTVKVSDLGLARCDHPAASSRNESTLTDVGGAVGTPDYMAPEQAEDSHDVDHRVDIYSLGCTLYRSIAGVVPYIAKTKVHKFIAHAALPTPRLCEALPEVPLELDELCFRMMAKLPQDRPATMQQVVDDLGRMLATGMCARFDGSKSFNRHAISKDGQSLLRKEVLPPASDGSGMAVVPIDRLPVSEVDVPDVSADGDTVLSHGTSAAFPRVQVAVPTGRALNRRVPVGLVALAGFVLTATVFYVMSREVANPAAEFLPDSHSNPEPRPSPKQPVVTPSDKDAPILLVTPGVDKVIYSSKFEDDFAKWRAEKGRLVFHEGQLMPFDPGARQAERWVLDLESSVSLQDGPVTISIGYSRVKEPRQFALAWPSVAWGLAAKDNRILRVDGSMLQATVDLPGGGRGVASARGVGIPQFIQGRGTVSLSATWSQIETNTVRGRLEYANDTRVGTPLDRLVLADAGEIDGLPVPFILGDGTFDKVFIEIKGGGTSASISHLRITQRVAKK